MFVRNRALALVYKIALVIAAGFGFLGSLGLFDATTTPVQLNYLPHITNAFVLLYFAIAAIWCGRELAKQGVKGGGTFLVHLKGAITVSVLASLVITYIFVNPTTVAATPLTGIAGASQLMVDLVVPLLAIADWLLFDPKGQYRASDPIVWLLYLFLYAAYTLLLGNNFVMPDGNRYPYWFLNVDLMGWSDVFINILICVVIFLVLGYLVFGLDLMFARLVAQPAEKPQPARGNTRKKRKAPSKQPAAAEVSAAAANTENEIYIEPALLAQNAAVVTEEEFVATTATTATYRAGAPATTPPPLQAGAPQHRVPTTAELTSEELSIDDIDVIDPAAIQPDAEFTALMEEERAVSREIAHIAAEETIFATQQNYPENQAEAELPTAQQEAYAIAHEAPEAPEEDDSTSPSPSAAPAVAAAPVPAPATNPVVTHTVPFVPPAGNAPTVAEVEAELFAAFKSSGISTEGLTPGKAAASKPAPQRQNRRVTPPAAQARQYSYEEGFSAPPAQAEPRAERRTIQPLQRPTGVRPAQPTISGATGSKRRPETAKGAAPQKRAVSQGAAAQKQHQARPGAAVYEDSANTAARPPRNPQPQGTRPARRAPDTAQAVDRALRKPVGPQSERPTRTQPSTAKKQVRRAPATEVRQPTAGAKTRPAGTDAPRTTSSGAQKPRQSAIKGKPAPLPQPGQTRPAPTKTARGETQGQTRQKTAPQKGTAPPSAKPTQRTTRPAQAPSKTQRAKPAPKKQPQKPTKPSATQPKAPAGYGMSSNAVVVPGFGSPPAKPRKPSKE